jgi:hypothetical protein
LLRQFFASCEELSRFHAHTGDSLGQTQDIMVSCDVVVLFTTVLTQVLTLFSDYFKENILRFPHVLTYCGPENLKGFPDQLNTHHQNSQFNMEMATFLDIYIYKRPDGSLGYKVYCKIQSHQPLPEFSTHYNPSYM